MIVNGRVLYMNFLIIHRNFIRFCKYRNDLIKMNNWQCYLCNKIMNRTLTKNTVYEIIFV